MLWYAETEVFIVQSDLKIADISILEILTVFSEIYSFKISFVMIVNENFFSIYNYNKCIVLFDSIKTFYLCHG